MSETYEGLISHLATTLAPLSGVEAPAERLGEAGRWVFDGMVRPWCFRPTRRRASRVLDR